MFSDFFWSQYRSEEISPRVLSDFSLTGGQRGVSSPDVSAPCVDWGDSGWRRLLRGALSHFLENSTFELTSPGAKHVSWCWWNGESAPGVLRHCQLWCGDQPGIRIDVRIYPQLCDMRRRWGDMRWRWGGMRRRWGDMRWRWAGGEKMKGIEHMFSPRVFSVSLKQKKLVRL